MTEIQRIATLFEDLYNGHPWLEVTLVDTLADVTAAEAAQPIPPFNSIWQIAAHLVAWRQNVLRRIQGEVIPTPDHNYILPVQDNSDAAWQGLLKELEAKQKDWLQALSGVDAAVLAHTYPVNGMSYYQHIHGILQHDAYHLGQIVLLKKWVRNGG